MNYLDGSDDVSHWRVCSICEQWTQHQTGRKNTRMCLACDLFDAEIARRRNRELQSALRAALHLLAQKEVDCDNAERRLAEVAALNRVLAGGEPTADLEADTGDLEVAA